MKRLMLGTGLVLSLAACGLPASRSMAVQGQEHVMVKVGSRSFTFRLSTSAAVAYSDASESGASRADDAGTKS